MLLQDQRPHRALPDETPALELAAAGGHVGVVRLLLQDRRAHRAIPNDVALEEAARGGHEEVLRLLLLEHGSVNVAQVLRDLTRNGHRRALALLQRAVDKNAEAFQKYRVPLIGRGSPRS